MRTICVFLILLVLPGCSTLQYVSYSVPSLKDSTIETSRFGDGIAFPIPEACITVREQSPSAQYWNLFIGPLVFPVFPNEIFGFFSRSEPEQFWVTVEVQPRETDLSLDLSKIWLSTRKGEKLTPVSFGLHHHYQVPQPIRPISEGMKPITITVGFHSGTYTGTYRDRPYITLFSLGFNKPSQDSQMMHLAVDGLMKGKSQVTIPRISFSAKTTYLRMLFSGQGGRDNISPFDYIDNGLCK